MLQRRRARVQVGVTGKETALSRGQHRSHSVSAPRFFCDQARSNWDSVTSATQFHCPKLYTAACTLTWSFLKSRRLPPSQWTWTLLLHVWLSTANWRACPDDLACSPSCWEHSLHCCIARSQAHLRRSSGIIRCLQGSQVSNSTERYTVFCFPFRGRSQQRMRLFWNSQCPAETVESRLRSGWVTWFKSEKILLKSPRTNSHYDCILHACDSKASCNFYLSKKSNFAPVQFLYLWAGRVETLHKPPNTQFELTPWCAAVIYSLPSQWKKQWKTPLLTGFTAYFVTHGHPFLHLFWHSVMPMHPYCTQQQHT